MTNLQSQFNEKDIQNYGANAPVYERKSSLAFLLFTKWKEPFTKLDALYEHN